MATKIINAGEQVSIQYTVENIGNASGSFWVGCTLSINGNEINLDPQSQSLNPGEPVQGRFLTPSLTMTGNYNVICALWKTKPISGITPPSDRILDSGWIGNAIQVIPIVVPIISGRFVIGSVSMRYYPSSKYVIGAAQVKNTGTSPATFYVGMSGTLNLTDPWSGPFLEATPVSVTLNPGEAKSVKVYAYPTQGGKYKFIMGLWDRYPASGAVQLDYTSWYEVII